MKISFHQIAITTLSLGVACGIIGCAIPRWNSGGLFDLANSNEGNAIKATAIIGIVFIGFALLLEILMIVSDSFKANRAINILCLICCIVAVIAMLVALILYGSKFEKGGYSVWLFTASTVFAIEALFFYVVQWRCT